MKSKTEKTIKKILSIAMCVTLIMSCVPAVSLPVSATAAEDLTVSVDDSELTLSDSDGDGYYEIRNQATLRAFAVAVNDYGKYFINGELTRSFSCSSSLEWTPIGNRMTNAYRGNFDGHYYIISRIYCSDANAQCAGLFGYIGLSSTPGSVRNLGISGSSFTAQNYIGSVAACLNNGVVENCTVKATINGSTAVYSNYVGGIVGHNKENGVVRNCNAGCSLSGEVYVGGVVGYNENKVIKCNKSSSLNDVSDAGQYLGGVVGYNAENATVEDCYNSGAVQGNSYIGGVVGYNLGTVKRSYNKGNITADAGTVGGVAGNNLAGIVTDCYNLGDVCATSNYAGGIVGDNRGSVSNCYNIGGVTGNSCVGSISGSSYNDDEKNCYYLDSIGVGGINGVDTENAVKKSEQEFNSGEVTYRLNNGVTDGTQVWYQTCGSGYPKYSGSTVYCYQNCNNEAGYRNVNSSSKHEYKEGICTTVDGEPHYQAAGLVNGNYEIANKGQLMWFAQEINSGAIAKNSNAKLINDIDMTGIDWISITSTGLYYSNSYSSGYGNADTGYAGTFDGNGHVIKNLTVTAVSGAVGTYGLFGTMTGTVKNLGIEGFTYNHNGASDMRTGAIVGQNLGGTIENCYVVKAIITPGTNVAGGITGCNYAGTIKNCYVADSNVVASSSRYGYIAGDNRADTAGDRVGTIENCYTDGDRLVGSYTGTETNSKYGVNYKYFTNGGLVWYLNGQSADGIWKQGETRPNFTGTAVTQSLLSTYTEPSKADGVYQITNESELRWFAEYVNMVDASVSAVLKNDIRMEGSDWISIGMYGTPFTGTFDGAGKSITNFKMNITEGGNYGVFGYLVDGTVKNFSVSGNAVIELSEQKAVNYGVIGVAAARNAHTYVTDVHSTVTMEIKDSFNKNSVAGIVGYAEAKGSEPWYRLYIERCSFGGSMNFGTAYVDVGGGIAGYASYNGAVYIKNCLYNGTITSQYEGAQTVGGIVGYNRGQNMRINNCLSVGTIDVTDAGYAGAIAGRYLVTGTSVFTGSKVTNNYYSGDLPAFSDTTDESIDNYNIDIADYAEYTDSVAASVTDSQLQSGEVAYILQSANSAQVWGQDNNQTGATPVLDSTGIYKVVEIGDTGTYSVSNVGDVNGDGTVDVNDYQALVNTILADNHQQIETASYDDIVKYDLAGDGYLDVLDASLMEQVINGYKTPVVYAVGDFNCDGIAFDESDLSAIKNAIENPTKLSTAEKYACDINVDGKVSEADLAVLTCIYG